MRSFTQIPNELIEALYGCQGLNETDLKIVLYLCRKIYGYQKRSDKVSLTQFERELGVARSTAAASLKRLKLVGLVKLVRRGLSKKSPNEFSFNLVALPELVRQFELVRIDCKKLVRPAGPTKEIYTKERKDNIGENLQDIAWRVAHEISTAPETKRRPR